MANAIGIEKQRSEKQKSERTAPIRIVCLPGDGIGPEIMASAVSVVEWLKPHFTVPFEIETCLFGGASLDKHGMPLTEETLERCRRADAVLLAAVGGPKWDKVAHELRPEAGLLKLRQELALYCNLRPARVYDSLLESSPLKAEVAGGTDMVVVRELTGGIYFGSPRGASATEAWNTDRYNRDEVVRITQAAFSLARKRRRKVTSVDKANVLEVSRFWRQVVEEVHADFRDVELDHMYVDNAAMQLVRNPKSFDVVLTSNLFGDILSDLAGTLTGSLGMLPSASLGLKHALYEPVHGSAPDIAGKDKANPFGMIGSLALCLRHSLGRPDLAEWLDEAMAETFKKNLRTADVASPGMTVVGTRELTAQFIQCLEKYRQESSRPAGKES